MKLTREVKTGILAVGGIMLFIFGYNFLNNSNIFDSSRTFYVKYNKVDGLAPSAPVTINGLQVGKVKSIDFADARGGLLVTFTVESDFQFSKNSTVEIYSSGFIGGNNLGIVPDFEAGQMARNGDTLQGRIQKGMIDGFMDSLDPIQSGLVQTLSKVDTLLDNINAVMDEDTKDNLRQSVASLNASMASFRNASANIDRLLSEKEGQLSATFENLDRTSANFAQISDSLSQVNIKAMMADLESTLAKFNALATKIEQGEGSVGKLLNDEELYNNLAGASAQLEALLQDMKENPKRYVHFSIFGKKNKAYVDPDEQEQNPE